MALGVAYLNGSYCPIEDARISVLEPGFTHSDVVYDVTSTWRGLFFRLDDHIERFRASCAGFRIGLSHRPDQLKRILANCVERGGVGTRSYCALVATRGPYSAAGERTRDIFSTTPSLLAYAIPYIWLFEPTEQKRGVHLMIAKTPRIPSACVDARYKNYHWGDFTQGKFEAQAAGADHAVHLSTDGYLTEGAGFNIFFVKDGCLYTPARNILEGITRQSVLELAKDFDIPTQIGEFRAVELRAADEAFITSTAGGLMPVLKVDDQTLGHGGPGTLFLKLHEAYWRRREAGWLGTAVSTLVGPERSAELSAIGKWETWSGMGSFRTF
jgi:branched-chain amino acid aminotransferase